MKSTISRKIENLAYHLIGDVTLFSKSPFPDFESFARAHDYITAQLTAEIAEIADEFYANHRNDFYGNIDADDNQKLPYGLFHDIFADYLKSAV